MTVSGRARVGKSWMKRRKSNSEQKQQKQKVRSQTFLTLDQTVMRSETEGDTAVRQLPRQRQIKGARSL